MAVGTGKGERGGSLRGGMQMQLSGESLPLSGRFNGWESCYLHPEKGYVEEQFGAGAHWKEGGVQISSLKGERLLHLACWVGKLVLAVATASLLCQS